MLFFCCSVLLRFKPKSNILESCLKIQNLESVMLNKLFRNIKENANLDALEESDDEDEFENICDDKFVDLEKTYNMECVYNKRTHKWIPKKVVNTSNLTNVKHLTYNLNKKFKNKKY